MKKASKIISYILVVFILVCGIAVICKYGNSSVPSSIIISEKDFCSLGFSARMDILPNSYLRYGVKISESYYKSLLEKDRDTEIGILLVSERYLGNGKILEYSTAGAKKEILNDSLATQTADETGYFSAFVTSPLITDLNETYYGVGYVKSGENISYTERRSTNVVWLLEQEYLNENSTVDKSLLLPYLSENFKKEHGLLEESEKIERNIAYRQEADGSVYGTLNVSVSEKAYTGDIVSFHISFIGENTNSFLVGYYLDYEGSDEKPVYTKDSFIGSFFEMPSSDIVIVVITAYRSGGRSEYEIPSGEKIVAYIPMQSCTNDACGADFFYSATVGSSWSEIISEIPYFYEFSGYVVFECPFCKHYGFDSRYYLTKDEAHIEKVAVTDIFDGTLPYYFLAV